MTQMTLTKPRKKRCFHQSEEAPFPIPIETITHKPASNGHWFFYQAQMIDNNVIVQNEGDIIFLSKMGFFGKGILSRSKPEHQFFASSFQGSQRKNLPPKERRFQQQRFQQVRQHKYERHLSWQKQLLLQKRQNEETKEPINDSVNELATPGYRVPAVPAKRVKRATISERNQRAGIMTSPRSRTLKGHDGQDESVGPSGQNALDRRQIDERSSNGPQDALQRTVVKESSDYHVPAEGSQTVNVKSGPLLSSVVVTTPDASCCFLGVDDNNDSKMGTPVFQSRATEGEHTITACERAISCLPDPDVTGSGHVDVTEEMPSSVQSGLVWETRHADWEDYMDVGGDRDKGHDDKGLTSNNDTLPGGSSVNRTSTSSLSSWRTDPKDWELVEDSKKKSTVHSQSETEQQNEQPPETTERESIHSVGHDRVSKISKSESFHSARYEKSSLTTETESYTSALGMDQTSVEGSRKKSSGHLSWSESWTSDPRDWDIGEQDQTLMSKEKEQVQKDSEEDQGFDDSCEVSEQQNVLEMSDKPQSEESDHRIDLHRECHDEKVKPSTSMSPDQDSMMLKSEELLLSERMERDILNNDPKIYLQEEQSKKSDDNITEREVQMKQDRELSKELMKPQEGISDCLHGNTEDAIVAVPMPVEFEDATTSQTESNNILSLKGRDARKKIREVKGGPVRNKDPYPIFEYLQLSYEEAFFLSYGLGCLALKSASKKQMDLTDMWRTFRLHQPSFVANYVVYHFYRSKGWVPKTGLKFGADFILYKKGPPFFHASYCVYVFMINEEDIDHQGVHKMNWATLMGRDRVIENAAKELMFCFVIKPSKLRLKDLNSPACIPHFKVQEMLMKRWVPSRGRQHEQMAEEVS